MPIQTQIKYKDFIKAVKKYGASHFDSIRIDNKPGSARRIEIFDNEDDDNPLEMWVVHESEYVYSDDFKKTYEKLGITKEELEGLCSKRKKK